MSGRNHLGDYIDKAKQRLMKLGRRYGIEPVNARSRFGINMWSDISRFSRGPCAILFDVGANVGQSVKAYEPILHPGHIHCFEPFPSTFAALRKNVGDLPNVTCHQIAMGASAGQMRVQQFENSLVNSLAGLEWTTAQDIRGKAVGEVDIEVDTIDGFCEGQGIAHIDVLKIDTEGYDLEVISGAERMIRERNIDFIITEFTSLDIASTEKGNLLPFLEKVSPHGYALCGFYTEWVIVNEGRRRGIWNALFVSPDASI